MLFVSSHFYALGRQHGIDQAVRIINLQLQAPDRESLPVVRVVTRLREIEDLQLRLDTGATCIGKARSRAFHDALAAKDCDVWVTIDDDLDCSMVTLRWMLEAVRSSDGICIVPYLLRPTKARAWRTSVEIFDYQVAAKRQLSNGGAVIPGVRGGFGLVAMSRHAMVEIAAANEQTRYQDDDGVSRLGVFQDLVEGGRWYGEDLSFFRRVPSNVPIEVLVTGDTVHDGAPMKLEHLETVAKPSDEEQPPTTKPEGSADAS
jgi:hypothetical protein